MKGFMKSSRRISPGWTGSNSSSVAAFSLFISLKRASVSLHVNVFIIGLAPDLALRNTYQHEAKKEQRILPIIARESLFASPSGPRVGAGRGASAFPGLSLLYRAGIRILHSSLFSGFLRTIGSLMNFKEFSQRKALLFISSQINGIPLPGIPGLTFIHRSVYPYIVIASSNSTKGITSTCSARR